GRDRGGSHGGEVSQRVAVHQARSTPRRRAAIVPAMANELSARWAWSDEARVMVRPYRTYAALAERDDDEVGRAWVFARGPALWALFMGAFVSLTAAGRLVWWHLALSALSWAFLPVVQSLWLLVVTHRRGA